MGEDLQYKSLRFQGIDGQIHDIKPGQGFHQLAYLPVVWETLVLYLVRSTADLMEFNIGKIICKQLFG